jgi:hypothetical protein
MEFFSVGARGIKAVVAFLTTVDALSFAVTYACVSVLGSGGALGTMVSVVVAFATGEAVDGVPRELACGLVGGVA